MAVSKSGDEFMDRLSRGGERSREILKVLTREHPELFSEEYDTPDEDPEDVVLIYRERTPGDPYKGIVPVKAMTRHEMERLTPDPEMIYEGLRHQFNVANEYNRGREDGNTMVLVERGEGSDRRYRLSTVSPNNSRWQGILGGKSRDEN